MHSTRLTTTQMADFLYHYWIILKISLSDCIASVPEHLKSNFHWESDGTVKPSSSIVPYPDSVLLWEKWSGDLWAISRLCQLSNLDLTLSLRYVTCARPTELFVISCRPHLCCATQVTWLMAFCWLVTTKNRSRPLSSWVGGVWERDFSYLGCSLV